MNSDLDQTDEQLVTAINQGDADAFAELYRRHRDWTVSLAWRFTGDPELALDVMQDVFAYFLKQFPGFKLTAQLRTYLYPIVRSTAATHLRKRKKHAGDQALSFLAGNLPRQGAERIASLHEAISALPDAQREVVLMRIVDEMHTKEIAAALSIPAGTVKSRLHNALNTLRENPGLKAYFEASN